ncbi:MAG: AMP-binding protein, partial [Desulfobacula sp.]|nr:AMP-binding protein [Desulfobacula sp.]
MDIQAQMQMFLEELRKKMELWIEGDNLRYRASEDQAIESELSQIKQDKQKILKILKQGTYISKTVPASRGQQALYLTHELAPESSAYNIGFALRIQSVLDKEAMHKAIQTIVERHASLRTLFTTKQDGELFQNIYGYKKAYFEEIDAFEWTEAELKKQVQLTHEQPFDLKNGPLMRTHLFMRSSKEYVLLFSIHHIVFDGWSLWMILDELGKLYSSHSAKAAETTPELPIIQADYTDFVHEQSEMLASSKGKELWEYWQKQLSGELPTLNLPIDHSRPLRQTFNGATYTYTLPPELSEKITTLAREEKVSTYTLLLAAYQILLHRYTGQDDILVSCPTVGRLKRGFKNVVGYFVNPVVMRAEFTETDDFKTFLIRTAKTVLDAIKHQDYPFIDLVKQLHVKRDPSYSPLAQTGFVLQGSHEFGELAELAVTGKQVGWGSLQVEAFELGQQEGQEDLQLEMLETIESFVVELKYNTDLFNPDTIQRMADHFQILLQGIVSDPTQKISQLPILSKQEKHKILVEWNDTKADYPKDKCIHELFEEQAAKTPDAVAIVFEDKQLTYAELNEKASQLAHYLQNLGVKPETLVGICLERSLEMIIGLLGILKAGGAYVPLDPQYPKERLSFMLDDTQAPILLTQTRLKDSLPENKAKLICLDSDWKIISKESKENIKGGVTSDNLAYVIYTSGSTGRPKGVGVQHLSVIAFLTGFEDIASIKKQFSGTSICSFNFDVFVWEVFSVLGFGGTLHIISYHILIDTSVFVDYIKTHKIDSAYIPPNLLKEIAAEFEKSKKC